MKSTDETRKIARLTFNNVDAALLGAEGAALHRQVWAGLGPRWVLDTHVHLVGLGADHTGCRVHPRATSLRSRARSENVPEPPAARQW